MTMNCQTLLDLCYYASFLYLISEVTEFLSLSDVRSIILNGKWINKQNIFKIWQVWNLDIKIICLITFPPVQEGELYSYSGVKLSTTRCPSCFRLGAAVSWLEWVSKPSVHDLSLQTLGSSIMSRGASLSKTKQENISLFPSLHLSSQLFSSFLSHSPHSLSVSLSVPFRPPAFDKRITLLFIQGDWCC